MSCPSQERQKKTHPILRRKLFQIQVLLTSHKATSTNNETRSSSPQAKPNLLYKGYVKFPKYIVVTSNAQLNAIQSFRLKKKRPLINPQNRSWLAIVIETY